MTTTYGGFALSALGPYVTALVGTAFEGCFAPWKAYVVLPHHGKM